MGFWVDYNGKYFLDGTSVIPFDNRGFHYADGVFESMRYEMGRILFMEDHFQRLQQGMKVLKMEAQPFNNLSSFEELIQNLVSKNNLHQESLRIKLNVFRESEGLYTPQSNQTGYILSLRKLDSGYKILRNQYIAGIYREHKVPMDVLSNLKTTQKLVNVLGGIYAKDQGWHNSILLNAEDRLAEALNGNLFVIKENTVLTPPLSEACLDGVMRKTLMDLLQSEGVEVMETKLSYEDIMQADELWVTNVVMGIQPIYELDKKKYGDRLAICLLEKLNGNLHL